MKKSDLKDGMMVKDGDGILYLVINEHLEGFLEFEFGCLSNYNDNLTSKRFTYKDIIKVVDARNFLGSSKERFKHFDDFPILWERGVDLKPRDTVYILDCVDIYGCKEIIGVYSTLKLAKDIEKETEKTRCVTCNISKYKVEGEER